MDQEYSPGTPAGKSGDSEKKYGKRGRGKLGMVPTQQLLESEVAVWGNDQVLHKLVIIK